MEGEDVPPNFGMLDDEQRRNRFIDEFGELRRHLFAKHATTLSDIDQQKLRDGKHPSQSHSFATDAEPYRERLDSHLRTLGISAVEIALSWYHMDRIILSVTLSDADYELTESSRPWLFQGFEVLYQPSG